MTDKVFKIKIDKDEKGFRILEQPEDIHYGFERIYNDLIICRWAYPDYNPRYHRLFLRGTNYSQDERTILFYKSKLKILKALQDMCKDRGYTFCVEGFNTIGEI